MSRIQCQSFGSPNPLLAYQNSTSSSITTKNKRQPVSFQKSTTSRLLVSAIRTERKRTNFPTRHQPANIGKRAAKPRSAMVAVSTPGWTISRYGLVVPDTSNDAMKVENFEKGTSRDNRASGTPLFFDTDDYSSDEAFNSDKTPEVYESISNEDEPSLDFDFAPQYEPSDWTRPPPPLPAAAALALLQYVQARGHMNGAFEEAVLYLQSTGCPSDLVNESLVLWLFSIMRQPYWDLVDLSYASRLCAAQLEDRIEYILETEKSQQASNDFDMRKADSRAQNTLAAYVKRLCKRETVAKSARRYFLSKQKDLQWEPRDEYAPSIYHHRANKAEYKEPASVSPELSILPSIEKKELTQPTRKQPSRHCRGTLTNSVI